MENWYLCVFLLKGLMASYAMGHLLGKMAYKEYRLLQTNRDSLWVAVPLFLIARFSPVAVSWPCW